MAVAARDMTALLALSTVGWFFPLPSLAYTVGSVAQLACHLALVAARAPLGVIHEGAQSDNRLATIPDWPEAVGTAEPWPTCDVPAQPPHDGLSD